MPAYNKIVINYEPGEAERILQTQFTPEQQAALKLLADLFVKTLEDQIKKKEESSR